MGIKISAPCIIQSFIVIKFLSSVLYDYPFYHQVKEAELSGATKEELLKLLGRGRAKKGMFEGEMEEGELEIGQVSAIINAIKPAAEVVKEIWQDFSDALVNPLY